MSISSANETCKSGSVFFFSLVFIVNGLKMSRYMATMFFVCVNKSRGFLRMEKKVVLNKLTLFQCLFSFLVFSAWKVVF